MSPGPNPSESTGSAPTTLPALANVKSGAAPPKVNKDEAVKLKALEDATSQEKLPLHKDVMQLARLGEIGPIQKLFEAGKYSADYKDDEGITPLHVGQA